MGLDITAASRIRRLSAERPDSYDGFYVGAQPVEFTAQADGLAHGVYQSLGETIDFCAGSYSGYNEWREQLAKLAGCYPAREGMDKPHSHAAWEFTSGPFWELINFSDCEGVIGPKTSAKLAKDFADHQAKADSHPDEWFRDKYAKWRKAFELASDQGAVHFG